MMECFSENVAMKKIDFQNFATYGILKLLFSYSISNFGSYNNVNFKTCINGIKLINRISLRFVFQIFDHF